MTGILVPFDGSLVLYMTISDDTHRTMIVSECGNECGGYHNQWSQDVSRRLELVSSLVRCCGCEQYVCDSHCIFLAVSQPGLLTARMPTGTECPVLQKNCVVVDVVVIVAVIISGITIVHVWE